MTNPWREDYPILAQQVYGRSLVYLDNAATSQMPRQVFERITEHYTKEHANVHRGVHFLSTASTSAVETVREKQQRSCMLHLRRTSYLPRGRPTASTWSAADWKSIWMRTQGFW